MHEGTEALEIGAGEKEKMRDLLGASSHLGLCNASHTNTTKRREEPRGDAPLPYASRPPLPAPGPVQRNRAGSSQYNRGQPEWQGQVEDNQ